MIELVSKVEDFPFGVEGASFPGMAAEFEVAYSDLEGFVDSFAVGGTRFPTVAALEEFGDEYPRRREERFDGAGGSGGRIHGVCLSMIERNQTERVEPDKITTSRPTSHHLGITPQPSPRKPGRGSKSALC